MLATLDFRDQRSRAAMRHDPAPPSPERTAHDRRRRTYPAARQQGPQHIGGRTNVEDIRAQHTTPRAPRSEARATTGRFSSMRLARTLGWLALLAFLGGCGRAPGAGPTPTEEVKKDPVDAAPDA